MNIGTLIDALYATRQKRLELTREVDEFKTAEAAFRSQIMDILDANGLAKASGTQATCGITSKIEPHIFDWEMVHEFVRTQNRFDLLQKRLSPPAWRDLMDAGTLVPGTDVVPTRDLSLTRVSRSQA